MSLGSNLITAILAVGGGILIRDNQILNTANAMLSPVHLQAERAGDGSFVLEWIRRGRLDSDSWLGPDIPLGEALEQYVVRIAEPGGPAVREVTLSATSWTYTAALFAADFPSPPDAIYITVRQVSQSAGEGLPAKLVVSAS